MNPKKILIVNLGGIGDLLLSTPSLRAIKNNYPEAEISILVVSRVYEIVKNLPYIGRVYIFQLGYSPSAILMNFWVLLRLRKVGFDLLINMRTVVSLSSAIKLKFILSLIKPKAKAGRNTDGRVKIFEIEVSETLIGQKYEMNYDIEIVEALGVEVKDRGIDFKVNEESAKKIDEILDSNNIPKEAILIGIHPGGLPTHRWPIKNFAYVIDRISKRTAGSFLVTGSKEEFKLAKKLINQSNAKIINLAGKLSLPELAALIRRCNLYISNDTGPMHIAAIFKTPLVAIFGPGYLLRYDPKNISDKAIVLHKRVDCAPCNKANCVSMKCLKAVLPDEVAGAALGLLNKE